MLHVLLIEVSLLAFSCYKSITWLWTKRRPKEQRKFQTTNKRQPCASADSFRPFFASSKLLMAWYFTVTFCWNTLHHVKQYIVELLRWKVSAIHSWFSKLVAKVWRQNCSLPCWVASFVVFRETNRILSNLWRKQCETPSAFTPQKELRFLWGECTSSWHKWKSTKPVVLLLWTRS